MKQFIPFTFLLLLFQLSVFSGYAQDKKADSLRSIAAKSTDVPARLHQLLLLATYQYNVADKTKSSPYTDALHTCNELSMLSRKTGALSILAETALLRAKCFSLPYDSLISERQLDTAFAIFHFTDNRKGMIDVCMYNAELAKPGKTGGRDAYRYKALNIAWNAKDTPQYCSIYKTIARAHLEGDSVKQSITELSYIYSLQLLCKDDQVGYTADILATAYDVLCDYPKAIKFSLASVDHALQWKDTASLPDFYSRLGDIYYTIERFDMSEKYFRLAYGELVEQNAADSNEIVRAIANVGYALLYTKNPVDSRIFMDEEFKRWPLNSGYKKTPANYVYIDSYVMDRQYPPAEKYGLQLLADSSEFQKNGFLICWRMSEVYMGLKNYKMAEKYCNQAAGYAALVNTIESKKSMERLFFELDSSRGNYLAAIGHYTKNVALMDSMYSSDRRQQIEELTVSYGVKQKERDITALNVQNTLQQKTIHQAVTLRNTIIVASALLLLLLAVTFNRYRIKKRSNEQLQIKTKEIDRQNRQLTTSMNVQQRLVQEKDKLLDEKEWLIKEIHHRVKNNLQIVMSLLNSQSIHMKDETAIKAIRESQQRVFTISLIHQQLYQAQSLAVINMKGYIKDLAEHIAESLDITGRISFIIDVEDICLDIAQAVPVGLIINEAITNAVKHAFTGNRSGEIKILLNALPGQTISLQISDNGIGFSTEEWHQKQTMGISLIRGLARQLDATIHLVNDKGVLLELKWLRVNG